ncbi:hypothetical protein SNEBB_005505 [Seison nebaliae]|nr:hypothetical protein SNEBB_005505 [Seison nebaliae]
MSLYQSYIFLIFLFVLVNYGVESKSYGQEVIESKANDIWELLGRRTKTGATIFDCIESGLKNKKSKVGIYAPDAESYKLFDDIFNPVIERYHKINLSEINSISDFKDYRDLPKFNEFESKLIKSIRIRVGRSVEGYPFARQMTRKDRIDLEEKLKKAFSEFDGDLKGNYYSLSEMTEEFKNDLIKRHILYDDGTNQALESAGGYHDWPIGRGVYVSQDEKFIVWVNEEDHLRLISLEKTSSVQSVYYRLSRALKTIEKHLKFQQDPKLGYLTFCPTNIGTSMRASVHIQLKELPYSISHIKDLYKLDVRGTYGEHSKVQDATYDLSNLERIGKTEFDLVNETFTAIRSVIADISAGKNEL